MATKTTKPDAPKTAAAVRKPAAPRAAAPTPTPSTAKAAKSEQAAGTAVIHIDKEKHGGVVRGAVNGQRYELPVGSDVTVTEAILNSLRDSHVEFATVTPLAGEDADEGSSASSTVTGTAIRAEVPPSAVKTDDDGNVQDPPELRQITDKELTDGADQQASKEQAETADKDAE